MRHGWKQALTLVALLTLALGAVACGGGGAGGTDTTPVPGADGQATSATLPVSAEPGATGRPGADGGEPATGGGEPTRSGDTPVTAPLPPEQVVGGWPPNELGQIPILMYHHIGPEPEQFVRTPDQFRADLQWLYDNGFYVINLHDIIDDRIDVPAGKRPVVLTFDDSPASQFALTPIATGQLAIDPNSAVGILELFFAQHPDFGRGGHFTILPDRLFDWAPVADRSEQSPYARQKLEWLVANGYEIGNHTYDHANLATLKKDEIMAQLALANDAIQALLPGVRIDVITLPYGMYPRGGDAALLRGFQYEGRRYEWSAALLVGANPTVSPLSTEFEPFELARIQAFDDELDKWFTVFVEQPGILYVSDGNPETVTVPEDPHPWLVGTLDMSKLNGRELVRN